MNANNDRSFVFLSLLQQSLNSQSSIFHSLDLLGVLQETLQHSSVTLPVTVHDFDASITTSPAVPPFPFGPNDTVRASVIAHAYRSQWDSSEIPEKLLSWNSPESLRNNWSLVGVRLDDQPNLLKFLQTTKMNP